MNAIEELESFINDKSRVDLAILATHEILGLTGSKEGCDLIQNNFKLLLTLAKNLKHNNSSVGSDTCLTLINISASETGALSLLLLNEDEKVNIVKILLEEVTNEDGKLSDKCCMILANLSRFNSHIHLLTAALEQSDTSINNLTTIFTNIKYNKQGCSLNYLGPLFSNLSQVATFRKSLLDKEGCVIQRLLPFTTYTESVVRRGGVVGTLKNCCFDYSYHDWLLSDKVDILPKLLLPLAGGEEFDEEDNDKLPVELQYLPEDKQRESDPDIRLMLLETLQQLCATRDGREVLRNNNSYVILREYHKWEKDRKILLACENVIDILIRREDEIGEDNLKELNVPEEYVEKFNKMDQNYINDE